MPTVISAKEFAVQLAKVSRPSLRALSPRILDPLASLTGKTPQLHSNHATAAQPRRIGIAVSGGVDSMALVTLLARHYRSSIESAVQLHGFIVDHKLRDESTIESQFVAKEIAKQGVTPHILTLDWSVYSNQQKISSHQANAPEQQQQQQDHKPEKHHLETQARLERYRAIAQQCHALQIQELFVGHHSGDQVETVLFRLSRASGIDGLSGIQSMAPFGVLNVPEALDLDVVRPLLDFDKGRLLATCQELCVRWVEDPSNKSLDYQRNVIRHFQQQNDESNEPSPLSSSALLEFRLRMDRHRRAAWDQVRPWLRDIHFDTANGVCHVELQRMSSPASLSLPPVKSSADQGDSIQPASAGSPELVAWLKESESHVATRLVSFLVQWVNCRDHPPGREETQSMLEQMWLQNEVDLNKVVLDSGRGKKDDAVGDLDRSSMTTIYRRNRKKKSRNSRTNLLPTDKSVSGEEPLPSAATRSTLQRQQKQQPIQMAGVLFSPPRTTKGILNHWTLSRQPFSQVDRNATRIRLNLPTYATTSSYPPMDVLWDRRYFMRIQPSTPTHRLGLTSSNGSSGSIVSRGADLLVRTLTQDDVQFLRKTQVPGSLTELESFMLNVPGKARFTIPVVTHRTDAFAETLVSVPTLNIHLLPGQFNVQSRFKSDRLMDMDAGVD